MLAYIGFLNVDGKPMRALFNNRLNMFFKKNDIDPTSHGVVLNSYLSGLTPKELLINSIPERIQQLQKVLSVAKPGTIGRIMIKNFENILLSNTRVVYKPKAVY